MINELGQFVTQPVVERFWNGVDQNGPIPKKRPDLGPCWIRTKGKVPNGYSIFWLDGGFIGAHRWSYERYVGPIPDGLVLDHLCFNRLCIRPSHLEAVTQRENLMRSNTFQARNAVKTHCFRGHEFTPENTHWREKISKGKIYWGRHCKTCQQMYKRADRQKGIG